MAAKVRLIPAFAMLAAAFWQGSLIEDSAYAEENCLAAPNAPPPPGRHWYYHLRRNQQSKCWYLRTEGPAIPKAVAQANPDAAVIARLPAAGTIKARRDAGSDAQQLRPDQPAPVALGDRLTQGSTQDGAQAGWQAEARAMPSPDPPSPAASDKVARPDPPSAGAAQDATAENAPEETATAKVVNSDKDTGIDVGADGSVVKRIEIVTTHSEMPSTLILPFVVGLVIFGALVSWIVRQWFARRRTIYVDRRVLADSF